MWSKPVVKCMIHVLDEGGPFFHFFSLLAAEPCRIGKDGQLREGVVNKNYGLYWTSFLMWLFSRVLKSGFFIGIYFSLFPNYTLIRSSAHV